MPTTRPGLRSVVVSWWFLLYLVFFTLVLSFTLFILFYLVLSSLSIVRLLPYTDTPSRATVITDDLARPHSHSVTCQILESTAHINVHIQLQVQCALLLTCVLPLEMCSLCSLRGFLLQCSGKRNVKGIEPLTHQRGALGS